jgi:hypothetical protein
MHRECLLENEGCTTADCPGPTLVVGLVDQPKTPAADPAAPGMGAVPPAAAALTPTRFCGGCGGPVRPGAQFCRHCGQRLVIGL